MGDGGGEEVHAGDEGFSAGEELVTTVDLNRIRSSSCDGRAVETGGKDEMRDGGEDDDGARSSFSGKCMIDSGRRRRKEGRTNNEYRDRATNGRGKTCNQQKNLFMLSLYNHSNG